MNSSTEPAAQRYLVDGHWLEAVRIEPRRSGLPAFVLLHEGLGSVAHWKGFPLELAERTGAGVFVYSRYGHGNSDPLEGSRSLSYMHHEAQVVLPEILRQARMERPVLLGHSDGASIAILYAGMFPDSPAGLILEAPHVFVEEITVSNIAEVRVRYQETDLPRRLSRHHANPDPLFWAWNDIWLDARFREWNIESYLESIRCPVLVIQGAQDEYGTMRQIEAVQQRLPLAYAVVLDNCRHAPHRDRCEATLSAISSFLPAIGNF
ncbi:MAG TPA: alpha/beta hydrolase [Bryobacteraceae bacterium]|nr:alpha/beta hydrolase [Bryobacteraceae bacterium]